MARILATLVAAVSGTAFVSEYFRLSLPYVDPLAKGVASFGVNPAVAFATVLALSVALLFKSSGSSSSSRGHPKAGILNANTWFQGGRDVSKASDEYTGLFRKDFAEGSEDTRKSNYMKMVNHYYDLVTDFYEWGWGKSFHFGRRFKGEDFHSSLARHEHWLAYRGGFQPGQTLIDVGCGVGGPMRTIARFTGAKIIGINNNEYQIKRGTVQNEEAHLADLCSFRQTDFMNLPFEDNSIDGAYAIEATCHAPDKAACFAEILRVLKPGAVFVGYEWCMTDKYDAKNPEHQRVKRGIEEGDSLPEIVHTSQVDAALRKAGFQVVEAFDVSIPQGPNEVPWYATLDADGIRNGLKNWKQTRLGIFLTHWFLWLLETLRLAPKGSTSAHSFLIRAPPALAAGGKLQIFTPMYYFKAVKPAAK